MHVSTSSTNQRAPKIIQTFLAPAGKSENKTKSKCALTLFTFAISVPGDLNSGGNSTPTTLSSTPPTPSAHPCPPVHPTDTQAEFTLVGGGHQNASDNAFFCRKIVRRMDMEVDKFEFKSKNKFAKPYSTQILPTIPGEYRRWLKHFFLRSPAYYELRVTDRFQRLSAPAHTYLSNSVTSGLWPA